MTTYKLDELAKAAGISPRTIRYYIQRGVIPQPAFRGPDTAYGPEHITALAVVKRLQEHHWPLEEIGAFLERASGSEANAVAKGRSLPTLRGVPSTSPPPSSKRDVDPVATSLPITRTGEALTRYRVAAGLELLVSPSESDDALVQAILELTRSFSAKKERR